MGCGVRIRTGDIFPVAGVGYLLLILPAGDAVIAGILPTQSDLFIIDLGGDGNRHGDRNWCGLCLRLCRLECKENRHNQPLP